ncbi:MAG: hypothetical protein HXY40_13780 [Chloroflexi bacterium]|nr:hypothetical protein [Chloroflexota bacterium]
MKRVFGRTGELCRQALKCPAAAMLPRIVGGGKPTEVGSDPPLRLP